MVERQTRCLQTAVRQLVWVQIPSPAPFLLGSDFLFTTLHFIWIALCLIAIVGGCIFSKKTNMSFHTAACIMAVLTFCSEFSKILSNMIYVNGVDASQGMIIDPCALPLHLCSLFIFVFLYLPFCQNERIKNRLLSFFVPIGIFGAALAILIPTNGVDFRTIDAYQCFVYHAGMIWFALYLIITKQVNLGKQMWIKNLVTLFGLSVVMIWINGALHAYHTNFFFVVRPPMDGLPILNLDHGWYVYYATLVGCGIVLITLVHLPFILKEK